MAKIDEAQQILREFGLPPSQQNEIAALTLLALCGISPSDSWEKSFRHSLTISKGIMGFIAKEYGKEYAPNTRETFRRQVLHQFLQAHLVEYNPDDRLLPTNSPKAHYALTESALVIIKGFGLEGWTASINRFIAEHGNLSQRYRKPRIMKVAPVVIGNGKNIKLSPGKHNKIQMAVLNEFAPRFAPGATVLYFGDTAKKNLFKDEEKLNELNIPITISGKTPDIILFDEEKKRVFLIEAVTSHGPISPKRFIELEKILRGCKATKIYVTAFPDFSEFKKHIQEIAWETEVWLADIPDHIIHFDGDKFFS